LLHPRWAGNFIQGDFFETAAWPDERHFHLCILMVGRLAEVPAQRAQALLTVIARRCEKLLIYRYPGGNGPSFHDLARQLALRPAVIDDTGAGLVVYPAA